MQMLTAYHGAVHLLALDNMLRGDSASTAASKAYNDVIGKSWHVGSTYVVPIDNNMANVEGGLRANMAGLDKANIDAPVSLMGLSPQDAQKQAVRSVVAHGMWLNNPDGSGLTLTNEQGAAVTVGGKPYTKTWQELEDAGKNAPPLTPPGSGLKREGAMGEKTPSIAAFPTLTPQEVQKRMGIQPQLPSEKTPPTPPTTEPPAPAPLPRASARSSAPLISSDKLAPVIKQWRDSGVSDQNIQESLKQSGYTPAQIKKMMSQ